MLFDVDDTLSDYSTSERVGLLGHLEAEGLLGLFSSHREAVAIWRQIMDEEYDRYLAGELTFTEQQRIRTRRFLSHIGRLPEGGLSDDEATVWFAGYGVHRDAAWQAFSDAEPVLQKLAPDYRLGVVTNSSFDHQRRKLDTLGLLEYFGDALTCSEEHGAAKPSPSIFLAGCAALGLPPEEVAYVGDKYALDGVGARDAGLRAYWLDRAGRGTGSPIEAGVNVILSLHELPPALMA
ncbi:HAD family hydrolase [Sphaerisporangium fuscum]|uniref:HAD family hydrolase n=1 Tax=Sphaerisporangium fuscum TaxID=2835868 RepID=UPI001BDD1B2F|nr:HAD family hydrolase [Sphaerisporangium fuscum]